MWFPVAKVANVNGVDGSRRLNAREHVAEVFHRKNAIACDQSEFRV